MHLPLRTWLLLLTGTLLLVAQPALSEWRLVSQNLNRFFDDIDDPEDDRVLGEERYRKRVQQLAGKIERSFALPEVIALQEIEKRAILEQVADAIEKNSGRRYRALLIDGNDRSGMDVGYLLDEGLEVRRLEPLFADRKYRFRRGGRSVVAPLYARPPLLLEFCRNGDCFTLVNVHLRSMRGLRKSAESGRIAKKRRLQAETLARWVNRFQREHPRQPLALVGDFNALRPSDAFVDVIGTLIGQPDRNRPRLTSPDLVDPDLIDASLRLPRKKRWSYRYRKRRQLLDYLLLNQKADKQLEAIRYSGIDYRFSDHAALIARFRQP